MAMQALISKAFFFSASVIPFATKMRLISLIPLQWLSLWVCGILFTNTVKQVYFESETNSKIEQVFILEAINF